MWIDKIHHVHNQDSILRGFTFQDIIDISIANGDSAYITFINMLKESENEAFELMNAYESELNNIIGFNNIKKYKVL